MREILFRGKQRTMLDWVEGTGVFNDGTNTWLSANESNKPIACGLNHKIVLPETVGQYTGRKDKNGKKVFEHDILQLYTVWADGTAEKGMKVVVRWLDNDQCYVLATKDGALCDDFGNLGRPEYYEVIGNIHDNPELLDQ